MFNDNVAVFTGFWRVWVPPFRVNLCDSRATSFSEASRACFTRENESRSTNRKVRSPGFSRSGRLEVGAVCALSCFRVACVIRCGRATRPHLVRSLSAAACNPMNAASPSWRFGFSASATAQTFALPQHFLNLFHSHRDTYHPLCHPINSCDRGDADETPFTSEFVTTKSQLRLYPFDETSTPSRMVPFETFKAKIDQMGKPRLIKVGLHMAFPTRCLKPAFIPVGLKPNMATTFA